MPQQSRNEFSAEAYGLSPMQSGMLFQALLDGSGAAGGYDIEQLQIEMNESVDAEALGIAWTLVANRHPILSTSFAWEGVDEPLQKPNPDVLVACEEVDVRHLSEQALEVFRRDFLTRDRKRGFDLRVAPLMRLAVLRKGPESSEVIWTFHHILLDGRSIPEVALEAFESYQAILRDEPAPARPARRPFSDYVQWVKATDREASSAYFRELLGGKKVPTPLPVAEPAARPLPVEGYGESSRVADPSVRDRAGALVSATNTTLGTVVQAAWALVLARYTGDTDIVFGSTRACRRTALDGEAVSMVGLFINTLPVRANVEDERTVDELLRDLRQQSLRLRDHEHTPLVDVIRASELPSGAPLFETLVMFENRSLNQMFRASGDPRWLARECTLHEQPSPPLNVTVFDGDELEVRLLYDRRRFTPSSVERLAESLIFAIAELSLGAGRKLREVEVLPPQERRRLLFDWNDTRRAFPEELRIHEPFEQRALLQPDHVAVEMRGETLTYRQLEQRTNRLANLLRERGARPGVYVGVCLRRSPRLLTALMAVAKSGAAYVPLDPAYPADRLAFMLEDTRAIAVITERELESMFGGEKIVLDGPDAEAVDAASSERPPLVGDSRQDCYTIFTSGSTGKPKGVVLSHRAVINTLDWVNRSFQVGPGDRLLFVTSPCFDLSVYDVFGALAAGATVVVASEAELSDPAGLAALIVDQKITIWDSAPAALQRLTTFFPNDRQRALLRLVMLSGDWIPLSLPDAVKVSFPRAMVMSLGGATEAAIWSNWFPIAAIDPRWVSVPYGKPIQNCRYHVLDRRLQPVPVGVPGDLYIGGVNLAEGYLNRPELTAERFIPDPFGGAGERLYKTGDLARYFEDGELEFLGRADFQVKIRGYRVEMGEVDAALAQLPGVRDAVCAAFADASGQKSLVAYMVLSPGSQLDEKAIKQGLSTTLPEFMLPSQVIFLDALPLSSNGKVDRKALPSPTERSTQREFVAAESRTEQALVALWEELLRKQRVGVTDDFFELGGHSLLAVMLTSRIKTQFGVGVSLPVLLEEPTIRALSQVINDELGIKRGRVGCLQTFNARGRRTPLVLVPGVVGTAFTYRSLPRLLGGEHPVHVVDMLGSGETGLEYQTIEQMAERYEAEVLACAGSGPIIFGGFSFGVLAAFELAHRLRQRGRNVPLLISFDGFAPGYPEKLPLAERVLVHTREFIKRDPAARRQYLADRWGGVRARALRSLGRDQELVASIRVSDHELRQRMRTITANQSRAQRAYRPDYTLDCDMLLIRAEEQFEWLATRLDDPYHGWRKFIRGTTSLVTLPGQHLRLLDDDKQPLIAAAIAEHLDRLVPRSVRRI